MANEKEVEEVDTIQAIKDLVETELKELLNVGLQEDNIDNLGKLIDIHKDIENETYWKEKEEVYKMRYDYGTYYGPEDGMGASYGRRGVPGTGRGRGRYRGPEEKMNEMMEHYGNYSAASEAAGRGNYGAEQDSMRALECMLESVCDFMEMLERDAGSQEETQMIKKYARKIGEM